jgi:hypothetical protein
MKKLLILLSIFISSTVIACECSKYPLDQGPAIEEYISTHYGEAIEAESSDITWLSYYPSIDERIMAKSFKGTSCEGTGPNGELMFHCARSRKSDFRVYLAKKGCEVLLNVKSNYKNVSVKLLSSTCPRNEPVIFTGIFI